MSKFASFRCVCCGDEYEDHVNRQTVHRRCSACRSSCTRGHLGYCQQKGKEA